MVKLIKNPLIILVWGNITLFVMRLECEVFENYWIGFSIPFLFIWYVNQYRRALSIEAFKNELEKDNIHLSGYTIGEVNGAHITCFECGKTSYSQGDIDNLYCAKCNKFHK